ncbi:MAG: TonB family protein [Balneolaceae bacterium]
MANKVPKHDLKKMYPVFVETGVIAALLILILVANLKMPESSRTFADITPIEGPPLILPPTTVNRPTLTPPPPMPEVPIEIPDDTPLEQPPIEFDEFEIETLLSVPPLAEEVKIEVDYERLKIFEVLPTMIGGEKAFKNSIEYPPFALRTVIEGIVEVEFIVNKKGKVENPIIIRGIGGGCDEAVLKGIKLQKFTPGVKDGKVIEFRIKETVQFIILGSVK